MKETRQGILWHKPLRWCAGGGDLVVFPSLLQHQIDKSSVRQKRTPESVLAAKGGTFKVARKVLFPLGKDKFYGIWRNFYWLQGRKRDEQFYLLEKNKAGTNRKN